MKGFFLALGVIGLGISAFAQGTVLFDNRNITTGPAPVLMWGGGGARLSGTNYSAQLYSAAGDQRNNLGSLTPAETRVQFRSGVNAGFVALSGINAFTGQPVDQEVTVTPVLNGPATIQLRAWESRFATFEEAVNFGGIYGFFVPIFLARTGGGLLPPVELTGLESFVLIPEPSVLALFVLLGGGVRLLRTRFSPGCGKV